MFIEVTVADLGDEETVESLAAYCEALCDALDDADLEYHVATSGGTRLWRIDRRVLDLFVEVEQIVFSEGLWRA